MMGRDQFLTYKLVKSGLEKQIPPSLSSLPGLLATHLHFSARCGAIGVIGVIALYDSLVFILVAAQTLGFELGPIETNPPTGDTQHQHRE